MSEMVRRIEVAIAQAAYPDVHPDFTDAGWERMARAAIAAMNPPTAQMVEAAYREREKLGLQSSQGSPNAELKAMIDAALES